MMDRVVYHSLQQVVNAMPLGRTEFDLPERRCAFQTSQGLH